MSSPISSGSALLSNATTTATNLGNLILVTPDEKGYQPQNPPNPDGTPSILPQPPSFLFNYEGEQTAELSSDITDHYIEDNTAVQDQIALRPVRITTKGFISELNDVVPSFLKPLKIIQQKLIAVQAYTPGLSETATLAYNQAFQAYQIATNIANAAVSAWTSAFGGNEDLLSGDIDDVAGSSFPNQVIPKITNRNKQQTAFMFFYGYWIKRTWFTIQTPWAMFKNMAIEQVKPIQSEDTKTFTTFECKFKQMRTAQSAILLPKSAISQGRLANQSSTLNSQGVSTPVSDASLSSGLSSIA